MYMMGIKMASPRKGYAVPQFISWIQIYFHGNTLLNIFGTHPLLFKPKPQRGISMREFLAKTINCQQEFKAAK